LVGLVGHVANSLACKDLAPDQSFGVLVGLVLLPTEELLAPDRGAPGSRPISPDHRKKEGVV